MNLKEAFRYQNKLQSFMDEAQGILDSDANVTKVENTYLRHIPQTNTKVATCPRKSNTTFTPMAGMKD